MSVKEQLAEAIAVLPDDVGLEEAVERLYQIIRLNRSLQAAGRRRDREEQEMPVPYRIKAHQAKLLPGIDRLALNRLADEIEDEAVLAKGR